MRKALALWMLLALLVCAGSAGADGVGVSVSRFETLYAQNVQFINDNTGRHLLSHELQRDYDSSGNRMYRLDKGALHMEMYLQELTEQITRLVVTLTAPPNMIYGSASHNDFEVAGYHSYAILMCMSPAEAAADRYGLVEMLNWGIKQYGGAFETEAGDYRVSCSSQNGVATFVFENSLLMPKATEAPAQDDGADAVDDGEEGDGYIG